MRPMNRIALCFELPATAAPNAVPGEVQLIPAPDANGYIAGRDGRTYLWDDQARTEMLRQFAERGIDVVIDRDHASELLAPSGNEAPAAGWVKQLDMRADGSAWGLVEWTPRGGEQVSHREYRYVSPVFDYEPATSRIARLVSVGLVNKPNLRLQALNREEPTVKLSAAIAAALGLSAETATEADGVAAIGTLKTDLATSRNAEQTPSLERFVPRADYDAVLTRANNAEQQIKTAAAAAHTAAVDADIDAALKAGKITPASVDYHRASCADTAGLERFRAFVQGAPVIAPDNASPAAKPAASATALNADEQRVAELCGISAEQYAAERASLAKATA